MTDSFAERLVLARSGEQVALEELFTRWQPLLRLQARMLLGAELAARVDPADIVQEALAQAFENLDSFRGQTEGEWVAWVRRILAGDRLVAEPNPLRLPQAMDQEELVRWMARISPVFADQIREDPCNPPNPRGILVCGF